MARILIVDDEPEIRSSLNEALSYVGHEVSEAQDGDEGIEAYQNSPSEIVITDIHMTPKDGLELIGQLRIGDPQPKIIAMTGFGTLPLYAARELGAGHIFSKPFPIEDMLGAVRELLDED